MPKTTLELFKAVAKVIEYDKVYGYSADDLGLNYLAELQTALENFTNDTPDAGS